jgi:hypothetical protein
VHLKILVSQINHSYTPPEKRLLYLDLFDNPVTFVRGYKSTMIDLLPRLRVLDRKSI